MPLAEFEHASNSLFPRRWLRDGIFLGGREGGLFDNVLKVLHYRHAPGSRFGGETFYDFWRECEGNGSRRLSLRFGKRG